MSLNQKHAIIMFGSILLLHVSKEQCKVNVQNSWRTIYILHIHVSHYKATAHLSYFAIFTFPFQTLFTLFNQWPTATFLSLKLCCKVSEVMLPKTSEQTSAALLCFCIVVLSINTALCTFYTANWQFFLFQKFCYKVFVLLVGYDSVKFNPIF